MIFSFVEYFWELKKCTGIGRGDIVALWECTCINNQGVLPNYQIRLENLKKEKKILVYEWHKRLLQIFSKDFRNKRYVNYQSEKRRVWRYQNG
jgi:hypothetical protein